MSKTISTTVLLKRLKETIVNGNNNMEDKPKHSLGNQISQHHTITKRDAEAIEMPKVFGWEPLEATSKKIMKLLNPSKHPIAAFMSQPLDKKRRNISVGSQTKGYPKVRRQPTQKGEVEYETMLPLGYENRQEAREPPPVQVDWPIIKSENEYVDEQLPTDEYDYQDFAQLLEKHYSSELPGLYDTRPSSNRKQTAKHHHKQAHVQRYPNLPTHKVKIPNKVRRKIKPSKRIPSHPTSRPQQVPSRLQQVPSHLQQAPSRLQQVPSRIHQNLKHPANGQSTVHVPISRMF